MTRIISIRGTETRLLIVDLVHGNRYLAIQSSTDTSQYYHQQIPRNTIVNRYLTISSSKYTYQYHHQQKPHNTIINRYLPISSSADTPQHHHKQIPQNTIIYIYLLILSSTDTSQYLHQHQTLEDLEQLVSRQKIASSRTPYSRLFFI